MAKYELSKSAKRKASLGLTTWIDGNPVNLAGKDVTVTIPQRKNRPKHQVVYKAASQEDLKKFYALGNQSLVIKVETKTEKKEAAKAESNK